MSSSVYVSQRCINLKDKMYFISNAGAIAHFPILVKDDGWWFSYHFNRKSGKSTKTQSACSWFWLRWQQLHAQFIHFLFILRRFVYTFECTCRTVLYNQFFVNCEYDMMGDLLSLTAHDISTFESRLKQTFIFPTPFFGCRISSFPISFCTHWSLSHYKLCSLSLGPIQCWAE